MMMNVLTVSRCCDDECVDCEPLVLLTVSHCDDKRVDFELLL